MKPSNKPFLCGACKRNFSSERAIRDHIRDAHPTSGARIFKAVEVVPGCDDDPSYADLAIEAEIARATGQPTDDLWLLGE